MSDPQADAVYEPRFKFTIYGVKTTCYVLHGMLAPLQVAPLSTFGHFAVLVIQGGVVALQARLSQGANP